MTPLEGELRAFFERYARTFHEDVERFCDLYEFPCETVRLDGTVQRFSTKAEAVSVVVDWDMIDDAASPIRGWRQSYSLVSSVGGWKVSGSTLHQGSERMYRVRPNQPL